MDFATITGAITSAKAAAVILQTLVKLKLDNETLVRINDALQNVFEVQQHLFSANEQLFSLQKERDELLQKLKAADDWDKRAACYRMVETPAGTFLWQSVEKEPQHYACTVCFARQFIIPLNKLGDRNLKCPSCGMTYKEGKPKRLT